MALIHGDWFRHSLIRLLCRQSHSICSCQSPEDLLSPDTCFLQIENSFGESFVTKITGLSKNLCFSTLSLMLHYIQSWRISIWYLWIPITCFPKKVVLAFILQVYDYQQRWHLDRQLYSAKKLLNWVYYHIMPDLLLDAFYLHKKKNHHLPCCHNIMRLH